MGKMVFGDNENVYVDHDGVKRETEKAKLFSIHGEEKWIPKSIIVDENDEVVAVPKWWAEKNNLESDW